MKALSSKGRNSATGRVLLERETGGIIRKMALGKKSL
jgi:hypothetical protein